MERTLQHVCYQLLSGAVIGTAMDSVLPYADKINSTGQALTCFLEIGAQIGGTIILADTVAKMSGFNSYNTNSSSIDMIPAMMAMMGFQPNLMMKMCYLRDYISQTYISFHLTKNYLPNFPSSLPGERGPKSKRTYMDLQYSDLPTQNAGIQENVGIVE